MQQYLRFFLILGTFVLVIHQKTVNCAIQARFFANDLTIAEDLQSQQFFDTNEGRNKNIFEKWADRQREIMFMIIDKHRIFDEVRRKLSNILDFLKLDFYPCVIQYNCSSNTRDSQIQDLLNPGSYKRVEYTDLINNYIIKDKSGNSDKRFFDVIRQVSDFQMANEKDCNNTQSVQDFIHGYYNFIMDVNMMMFRMVTYAHLAKFKESPIESEKREIFKSALLVINEFKNHAKAINLVTRDALVQSPREIRRCDPWKHEKSRTWERLHNFIQAFVISGYYLKGENERHTCLVRKETHIDPKLTTEQQIPDYLSTSERLFNCTKSKVSAVFTDSNNNERIYDYIQVQSQQFDIDYYGKSGMDSHDSKWDRSHLLSPSVIDHSAGLAAIPIGQNYPVCLCLIDQIHHNDTLRRFSLTAVLTNPGMVVTGIRWVKRGGRFLLKIQEGRLINGSVDSSTIRWLKTVPNPSEDDVLNVDHRSISLDDVILPAGSFVTGVQLCRISLPRSDKEADTLTLCLWGTPVDKHGNLKLDQIFYGVNTTTKREEIFLDDPDGSNNDQKKAVNKMLREPGKRFVKFQPTSLRKDAGQTTVPYLDIQNVVTRPPAPISGVGLYYRGSKGFGGFIGLKLISADVVSIIDNENLDALFTKMAAGAIEEMQDKTLT